MHVINNIDNAVVKPTKTSEDKAPIHLAYLDGMRAIAAVYVVIYHAMDFFVMRGVKFRGIPAIIADLFHHGHTAVDVFIVLSGFCLMLPVVRGDQTLRGGGLKFFKKRARRILPPYYFALAFCLIAAKTVLSHKNLIPWDLCLPVSNMAVLTHILLIHDAFRLYNDKIDSTLWSIAVEWRIYFLFPMLVWSWRRIGPIYTTIMGILAGYAILSLLRHTSIFSETNGVSPHYVGLFCLGMLAAGISFPKQAILIKASQKIPWAPLSVAMTIALILLNTLRMWHGTLLPVSVVDTITGIWAASLLVAVFPSKCLLNRILSWSPLACIGTFSYSVYLIHPLILGGFQKCIIRFMSLSYNEFFYIQVFIIIPLTIAISYIFFIFFERPFINRKKSQ